MILQIEKGKTNKILRTKSEPVGKLTSDISKLIEDMKETLAASENGIGLAAPQIAKNLRLFVISPEVTKDGHTVFINPVISQMSRTTQNQEEGCLSLPETWRELSRSEKVTVKATDENGEKFKLRAKGLLARLIVHEVDHLNGILFVDHL